MICPKRGYTSLRDLNISIHDFYENFIPQKVSWWYELEIEQRQSEILARVEECLKKKDVLDKPPFVYPRKGWENVYNHPGYGLLRQPDSHLILTSIWYSEEDNTTYSRIVFVLKVIRQLLISRTRTTKRDIYYQNINFFTSQVELDSVVAIIAAMLQVKRYQRDIANSRIPIFCIVSFGKVIFLFAF